MAKILSGVVIPFVEDVETFRVVCGRKVVIGGG